MLLDVKNRGDCSPCLEILDLDLTARIHGRCALHTCGALARIGRVVEDAHSPSSLPPMVYWNHGSQLVSVSVCRLELFIPWNSTAFSPAGAALFLAPRQQVRSTSTLLCC